MANPDRLRFFQEIDNPNDRIDRKGISVEQRHAQLYVMTAQVMQESGLGLVRVTITPSKKGAEWRHAKVEPEREDLFPTFWNLFEDGNGKQGLLLSFQELHPQVTDEIIENETRAIMRQSAELMKKGEYTTGRVEPPEEIQQINRLHTRN
jgi:hypothetical protein